MSFSWVSEIAMQLDHFFLAIFLDISCTRTL